MAKLAKNRQFLKVKNGEIGEKSHNLVTLSETFP
jgi:hypothetical protein